MKFGFFLDNQAAMKKNDTALVIFLTLLVCLSIICPLTSFYDRSPGIEQIISKVYKNELPQGITNEDIAKILVQRMMDKYMVGTRGWTKWVWSYEIKEIRLDGNGGFDEGVGVVLYVKPLIPEYWSNMWTFEVDWVDHHWVRVGYDMVIDELQDYYQLRGPFTGG